MPSCAHACKTIYLYFIDHQEAFDSGNHTSSYNYLIILATTVMAQLCRPCYNEGVNDEQRRKAC